MEIEKEITLVISQSDTVKTDAEAIHALLTSIETAKKERMDSSIIRSFQKALMKKKADFLEKYNIEFEQ